MFTLLEFDSIDSTSSLLKKHYDSLPHFTVIRANHQLNGRGQFDRKWDAEPHQNLLMSILLKQLSITCMAHLKQRIIDILLNILLKYGIHAKFKEPNDLYVNHEKICGILIETKANQQSFDYVIIGIGLNINQLSFGPYQATSMAKQLHKQLDLKVIFYDVMEALEKYMLKGELYV